jgi:hypothetical protein
MKKNIFLLTAIFSLALLSCSSSKVVSDYDDTINFSEYKTYGFSNKAKQIPVDDMVKTRLLNSISSNLTSKGLTESPNPDLLVDLAIKTEKKKDYSNTNVNLSTVWGKKWRFRTGVGKSYSKQINYTEGTLIIHLVDRAKDMLVWKGSGSGIVKEESLKKENIAMGINKILESYPPQ